MATAKIGALLIAWELADKGAQNEQMKSEIDAAFQRTFFEILPFMFTGVIHEVDGSAKLGIFQTKEKRDKWIELAKRSSLEIEVGNGYQLGYGNQRKFNIDLGKISGYSISQDYTNAIFKIA